MDNDTLSRLLVGVRRFDPDNANAAVIKYRSILAEFHSTEEIVGFLFAAIDAISHDQMEQSLELAQTAKGCI